MRILITGATGFLGKHLALFLKAQGHEVSGIGRNPKPGESLSAAGVKFLRLDLSEKEKLTQACVGMDAVIHSAALASPFGPYEKFYQANVVGTKNLVDGCLTSKVKRLVNISTPSLYFDYRSRRNISEADPLPERQVTHYGTTKLAADRIVEDARAQGLETISIRPRGIFGPEDQNVLPRLIQAEKRGRFLLVNGGNSLVDLSYIENVLDAIQLALIADRKLSGRTYNITNGEPMSVKTLVEKLFKALHRPIRFQSVPFWVADSLARAMEVTYSVVSRGKKEPPLTRYAVGLMAFDQTLDINLAKRELGYRPRVSFDEGLARYVRWLQKRPV